jgi:hypothetical protein
MSSASILDNKDPDAPSVFEPAALLREARRQKLKRLRSRRSLRPTPATVPRWG